MTAPSVTVIVCCHNSEARIGLLSRALAGLDRPEGGVEFLLVDNASRDGTRAGLQTLVAHLASTTPAGAQVVDEPRPGLMYARCAAVARSRGRWVVFFDDDNEPDRDYLVQCLRLAKEHPEAVVCTGNSVLPEPLRIPPGAEEISRALALRQERGESAFRLDRLHCATAPFGAGMCTRGDRIRTACEAWSKGNQKVVGRQGNSLSSSEDVWLTHYLAREGGEVVFSERLLLRHHIRADRLESEYLCRLAYANGRGYWNLVEAIRELRPGLAGLPTSTASLLRLEMAKAWVKLAKLLLRPTIDALARLAFSIGVIADCYFRRFVRGGNHPNRMADSGRRSKTSGEGREE